MAAALTFRATTPAELDAIDSWVIDCWLDAPVPGLSREGELRLSIEQSPDQVDPAHTPAELPQPRNRRKTAWYDEWEQPVLACTLIIRRVEEILEAPDQAQPLFSGMEFDSARGTLELDWDTLRIRVAELDVELEVMPEVIRWTRRRWWQIGPVKFETGGQPS